MRDETCAGIVDQHINPPPQIHCFFYHGFNLVILPDVTHHCLNSPAGFANAFSHRTNVVHRATSHKHLRATLTELAGNVGTNSCTTASDNRHLPANIKGIRHFLCSFVTHSAKRTELRAASADKIGSLYSALAPHSSALLFVTRTLALSARSFFSLPHARQPRLAAVSCVQNRSVAANDPAAIFIEGIDRAEPGHRPYPKRRRFPFTVIESQHATRSAHDPAIVLAYPQRGV